MWEIQPDWTLLPQFWVRAGGKQFTFTATADSIVPNDRDVSLTILGPRSFDLTLPSLGNCIFLCPRRTLNVHGGSAVTGIDVTSDGHEILSGSRNGKLFLTHLGTAPVPLLGPTEGVEIEDCIVDSVHQLFFAGSADFRIYEFSATEYRFTSRYEGHTGPVTKVGVAGDQLYSGSRDRSIMIWDIGGQKRLGTIGLSAPVNGFCFCDSGLVFAACDSRVLGVDARAGGTAVSPPCNGDCDFNGIAAKGNELTAGDSTGVVIQWDVRNLEGPVAQWSWYDAPINEVAYNGGKLWVLTGDGTAAQIDMTEKRSQVILGTKAYAPLYSVAFWNQITIWTADDDGTINSFEL